MYTDSAMITLAALAILLPAAFQDNADLQKLVEADQADRQGYTKLTEAQRNEVAGRDRVRRAAVQKMLDADILKNARDFKNAALLFQHGEKPEDFLAAHELYLLSETTGGPDEEHGNGLAISEDRFLDTTGEKQRFSPKFDFEFNAKLPETDHPASVTDPFRLDFFSPPLSVALEKKMEAFQASMDLIFKRLETYGEHKARRSAEKDLERLSMTPNPFAAVVQLYREDKLRNPQDAAMAANILSDSPDPQVLLLAHELAGYAAVRKDKSAFLLFAVTMDKYLVSKGRAPRYGRTRAPIHPGVSIAVRKRLGLGEH